MAGNKGLNRGEIDCQFPKLDVTLTRHSGAESEETDAEFPSANRVGASALSKSHLVAERRSRPVVNTVVE